MKLKIFSLILVVTSLISFSACSLNKDNIFINGQVEETIEVNTTFIDKGVSYPNNLTLITDGEINTSILGRQEITYKIYSSDGELVKELHRFVTVIDTIAPTFVAITNKTYYVGFNYAISDFVSEYRDNYNNNSSITTSSNNFIFTTAGQHNVNITFTDSSNNSTIYATRDLATIYSRMNRFNPDEICYVVDNRQGMYFKQVFRSSYKSGLVKDSTELNFYGFGTMNGSDGKPFKTRDGGVMELRQLISMVEDVTYTKLKETIVGEERRTLAGKLAIAVLKYADLLPLRNTDYIFDVEKFASLEGKTGPYILYTAVRINSIFSKLDEVKENYTIKGIYSDEELNIYIKIIELTKTIDAAFNEKTLSYICDYLFNLANLYNKFYSEHNILNEEDENKKETYLALSKLTYSVIEKLLNVLAIDMIDKM